MKFSLLKFKPKTLILTLFILLGLFISLSSVSAATKTLYAWAKDAAGNISTSQSDSVTITISEGTTYYISPTGNNTQGDGSIGNPWKTLKKACDTVTTSGATIHVKTGEYTETEQCVLAVGVSIEGEGITSYIKSHYDTGQGDWSGAAILLASATEGTNGNQSISYLKLDGEYGINASYGSSAIIVRKRSNVKIHNCTIVNFFRGGVSFVGVYYPYTQPSIYATGNEIYNNIMSNMGDTPGGSDGIALITAGGQDGLSVHDNIFTQTERAIGHNGEIWSGGYYNKGVKFYNNKCYKNDYEGDAWNFHIEHWDAEGGMEVYNNEFYGGDVGIDVAGHFNTKGNYDYSWSIHDNLFTTQDGTSYPLQTSHGKHAIDLEGPYVEDILIYNNHFLNIPSSLGTSEGNEYPSELKRVYFYNNLMENSGWQGGPDYNDIIHLSFNMAASNMSDIYILNNVIMSDAFMQTTAIGIGVVGTTSNINIKNNIMVNHHNGAPIRIVNTGTFEGLHIDNNLIYNDVEYNTNPDIVGTVTNYNFTNNIISNPLFISFTNFHLQSNSPAINAGINVGLPYNGTAPDIGAYETNY